MKELRSAILGTGFWARYQLAAWREVPGAKCVALYNRTRAKADALAREFGVFDHWYSEVPSQTFMNRSFWTAATCTPKPTGGKLAAPYCSKWVAPGTIAIGIAQRKQSDRITKVDKREVKINITQCQFVTKNIL